MKKEEFIQLAEKITSGVATDNDIALYNVWYNSFKADANWNEEELGARDAKEEQLFNNIQTNIQRSNKKRLWPQPAPNWVRRIAVAAAAVAAITVGIWLYEVASNRTALPRNNVAYKNDIAPGHNGATLTFANGQVINLSGQKNGVVMRNTQLTYDDGSLVQQASTKETSPATDDEVTATTARGQMYTVTLQDGTKVWLNSDSKLEFISNFRNVAQRIVKLTGEAYFEVAHDAEKPFLVKSKGQVIEVLGTKFNINAYADEPATATTLLQGSVKVSKQDLTNLSANGGVRLQPGQQAMLTKNGLNVITVSPEDAIAWKNGYFDFKDESMEQVMRKLSRWYNIEVEFQEDLSGIQFEGEIPRNTSLSQVLKVLEAANVHFTIKGNKLIVKP